MKGELAEHHHTDLTVFHGIIALLEGGTIYTARGCKTASKIIAICNEQAGFNLRAYDRIRKAKS